MPLFIPALISGLAALGGGLANRGRTTSQSGTSTTNSSGTTSASGTSSTTPTYDPLQLQMRDFLLNSFYNRAQPGAVQGLVDTTIGQGVNNINRGYGTAQQSLSNLLAARGLSYSGAAGTAQAGLESSRIGETIGLRNQAPLMADQLQQSRLTDFSSFLRGLPTGSSTSSNSTGTTTGTSTTNSQGTATDPGNPLGGLLASLATTMAGLYGQGAFKSGTGTGNT